ncbi:Las1-domain-containing protein [Polyporus arcularius HHB13444]|uniref:Las1-domain-containing protein n=1 Tax=Polyporus arcularius HHB13444 TaxID=1314778 RepID=A0A5C3PY91_9APHY|nr:Las1-domain-containing protein [Polyporus arcularius HHB13444]
MQLPRRVPWESLAELEQVCSWIYSDENDLEAKQHAVNRLAAWRAAVPLPHALESAHTILSVLLQDGAAASSSTYLSLRMSYASAIIRLVNGLVDPLQLGAYARSIHSIAQQLGLPAWLVDLRHAATHEDLPSLEVLRDAAREVMTWLLHNYFLPTLNPSAPSSAPSRPLRPLAPLLKQYKTLLKATTRDATLHVQYRAEITRALRDIERWISEAKIASSATTGGVAWDDVSDENDDSEEDAREKWALDRLSEVLLEKGMLVPLSKKKRMSPGQGTLALPRSSVAIWSPLLAHLQALHPALPLHLVSAITAHLSRAVSPEASSTDFTADSVSLNMAVDEPKTDPSYDICLASWAKWLLDNCTSGVADADEAAELRENMVVRIVSALRPDRVDGGASRAANALLQVISAERPKLAAALSILSQNPSQSSKDVDGNVVAVMDTRLNALLALQHAGAADTLDTASTTSDARVPAENLQLPPGWRKLSERDGWRPAPIGVYVTCP